MRSVWLTPVILKTTNGLVKDIVTALIQLEEARDGPSLIRT